MSDITSCPSCDLEFEARMIQELIVPDGAYFVCPICALKKRNEILGLPKDTPFSSEKALFLWCDAKAYLHNTGQVGS